MDDQSQSNNNINQANTNDVSEVASASPSLDDSKFDLAEEYLNNWKRERADFVNYKKDEDKRMEEFVKFANEGLILELLDTMDDLYLAVKQVKDVRLDSARLVGLEQVIKKLEDLLTKYGIERIEVGDKFDPMYQEIVEGTEGEKIEEVRAGYTMYGRIIRPARVRLNK